MTVVALVGDLMDRSKLSLAIPDITFTRDVAGCAGAGVVVVDIARYGALAATLRESVPGARIIGFGSHVDEIGAEQARGDGADVVLPRSRFFRDPAAAVAGA